MNFSNFGGDLEENDHHDQRDEDQEPHEWCEDLDKVEYWRFLGESSDHKMLGIVTSISQLLSMSMGLCYEVNPPLWGYLVNQLKGL